MSFVSSSARTVTVNNDNNNDNSANYSNSDGTAEANNDNTNGSATTSPVVLRLASGGDDSRRRRRSPTAAAGVSLRSGGGIRRGIIKRPRASTSHTSSSEASPYVPAPVPEIIAISRMRGSRPSATRTLAPSSGRPSFSAGWPFAGRRRPNAKYSKICINMQQKYAQYVEYQ